jgi:single-stranded-DNA-specific exonuclease
VNIRYKSLSKGVRDFLIKREITDQETLERFLTPTFDNLRPFDEKLKAGIEELGDFIRKGEKILIWGDQDTDGITSTFIMKLLFKELFGIVVPHYIPDRRKEGYGLSREGIDKAYKEGINLIITVDSGTGSFDEVEYLKKKGMDVIITDHHELKENLPRATLLNPKLHSFGYKYLSGAGVSFKFADCLFYEYRGEKPSEWTKRIPGIPVFSFIGTIADKVPLLDENRIIYNEGLRLLKEVDKPPFTFLSRRKEISKALLPLAPLGSEKEHLIWKFFSARTVEEAGMIYETLKATYSGWNRKVREEFFAIRNELNEGNLVIFKNNLDNRIASSLANRIKDYFRMPVFIIYPVGSVIRGEGRSPEGFNLLSVFDEVKDLLIDYGGHKSACGFTLKNGKIEEFKEKTEPILKRYKTQNKCDSELELSEITEDLKDLIKKMEPFGIGNPPPVFLINNVSYEKQGEHFFLSNGKLKLKLNEVAEMPPPSKKVNAYLEIKGEKITLRRWEWIKE